MSGYNSDWLGAGEEVWCGPGSCSSLGPRAPKDKEERKSALRARTNFVKIL